MATRKGEIRDVIGLKKRTKMLKLCVINGRLAVLIKEYFTSNLDAESFMCVLVHYINIR